MVAYWHLLANERHCSLVWPVSRDFERVTITFDASASRSTSKRNKECVRK